MVTTCGFCFGEQQAAVRARGRVCGGRTRARRRHSMSVALYIQGRINTAAGDGLNGMEKSGKMREKKAKKKGKRKAGREKKAEKT